MFKKKEGHVTKSNRQMASGKRFEAYKTLEEGLDEYQKKIVRAICPYPTADSALLVIALKTVMNSILESNQECQGLAREIEKRFMPPKMIQEKETYPTKER